MKKRILIIALLLVLIYLVVDLLNFIFLSITPHRINGFDVTTDSVFYNHDSSYVLYYYTLDVGARGTRNYQALLSQQQYKQDHFDFVDYRLPNGLGNPIWISKTQLQFSFDSLSFDREFETSLSHNKIDYYKDSFELNGILIKIKPLLKF